MSTALPHSAFSLVPVQRIITEYLDGLDRLSIPKQCILRDYLAFWLYATYWLIYPPKERLKSYPFHKPNVREYLNLGLKRFLDWEEATFDLCVECFHKIPKYRRSYQTAYDLYAATAIENIKNSIRELEEDYFSIHNPNLMSQAEWIRYCQEHLRKYENFLKGSEDEFNKQAWGEILGDILESAAELTPEKSHKHALPAKTLKWIRAGRAFLRQLKESKTFFLSFHDERSIYRFARGGKREVGLPPRFRYQRKP